MGVVLQRVAAKGFQDGEQALLVRGKVALAWVECSCSATKLVDAVRGSLPPSVFDGLLKLEDVGSLRGCSHSSACPWRGSIDHVSTVVRRKILKIRGTLWVP